MLEIILMLLGLAFPNSESNNTENSTQSQITIENVQSTDDTANDDPGPGNGGTSGNGGQIPPNAQ